MILKRFLCTMKVVLIKSLIFHFLVQQTIFLNQSNCPNQHWKTDYRVFFSIVAAFLFLNSKFCPLFWILFQSTIVSFLHSFPEFRAKDIFFLQSASQISREWFFYSIAFVLKRKQKNFLKEPFF